MLVSSREINQRALYFPETERTITKQVMISDKSTLNLIINTIYHPIHPGDLIFKKSKQ